MKPQPRRRRRSKFLSFLLCSSHRPISNNNAAAFSPPRRSMLEYDDNDSDSASDQTINVGEFEARRSSKVNNHQDSAPVWSVGSLVYRFQNTPSPVCSTCSPLGSDSSASGVDCTFSTPRNQSPSKVSVSVPTVDIDDWIRDGRKHPYQKNPQPTRGGGETWMSCSSVYESAIGGTDQATLASIHEEEKDEHEEESPFLPYHKLLSRPKPYHEFLNEVEKQEIESKVQALHNDQWRKREAAIREWEMKQTRKAARELEELESKQKKELAKAVEKLQQKMTRIQSKVAEKKARGRLSCVSDDADLYSASNSSNLLNLSI